MSTEQRENLEAILRRSAFPAVPDVDSNGDSSKRSSRRSKLLESAPSCTRARAGLAHTTETAGEILVAFEEYTRHVDWPLTVLSASFVLRAR